MTAVVHAVVDEETAQALRRRAKAAERTVAAELRLALRSWLADPDPGEGTTPR